MFFETLVIVGWVCLSLDALAVLAMFLNRNSGDASSRGMAAGFGMILAPVVLVVGAALAWAHYCRSLPGVLVATLLAGLPFLFIAREVVLGPVIALKRVMHRRGQGVFRDPVLTAIARAVQRRDTARVTELSRTPGIDLGARDAKGRTLLGIAVKAATEMSAVPAHFEMVKALVEAGARYQDDAFEPNGRLFSSVVYNVGDQYVELMDVLLQAGANPNDTEQYDGRPLLFHHNMSAAKARVLLDRGADLQVRDTDVDRPGWDALMNAVSMQEWELALLYLQRGCNPTFRAKDGRTVWDLLRQAGLESPPAGPTASQSASTESDRIQDDAYRAFFTALHAADPRDTR